MIDDLATTESERRKYMKKIFAFVLVFAMIMAVTSIALAATAAYDKYYSDRYVYGGDAQWQWSDYRSEANSMDVKPTGITWNSQSGWKFRGYFGSDYGTVLKSIYGTQTYTAPYTAGNVGAYYSMRMSIASSNSNDNLVYSRYLYF